MPTTFVTFPTTLELSTLDGVVSSAFNGVSANDRSGSSVASAGDINGDGLSDLVIGAWQADPGNRTNAGSTFVVFGTRAGFGTALELSTLNGANGFRINGVSDNDRSGSPVASAGDINGDGLSDLVIGAWQADPGNRTSAGSSFVVFGTRAGFGETLELSTLNGTNGFSINGVSAGDNSGISVASAGDMNGDGLSDLVIGAWQADPGGRTDAGSSFVVFGTRAGFGETLELSTLNGTNGFSINGVSAGDNSGISVASAGDMNGDGLSDLVIGAWQADPGGRTDAGSSFVVFGTRAGFGAALELSTLNGANGFRINGVSVDYSGFSVASAGDMNGDGLSDLVIGGYVASPGGLAFAGSSFVVFGARAGFGAVLELSTLNGANGFRINGVSADDLSGYSVASVGDMNGDGLSDLIIGAPTADPGGRASAGSSFVVFGMRAGFGAALELSTLNGANGFRINGVSGVDQSGRSVASAGDMNGDGLSDLVIGANAASPGGLPSSGSSFVVFGDSPPVLANNSLTIGAGCTVTLDSAYLAAYDLNHANSTLVFTASNITNGNFQKTIGGVVTPLTTAVFSQSDIKSGYIQFVSTNGNAPNYGMAVSSSGLAFVPATPAVVSFTAPVCSEAPTRALTAAPTVAPTAAPSFMPTNEPTFVPTAAPSLAPSSSEISSARRTSPAWILPISQAISLLDSTLPKAYQSVSGYLSGWDASSQPDTHNASYTSPSLETVGSQLMLGAVALKLVQKGFNWAKSFWASEPALKAETAPVLSEIAQSVQMKSSEPISHSATKDLTVDMKQLSEKMETYQACLEETSAQTTNVVYPDFEKPGINFAYNAGARKRTPSTVEQAMVPNTRLMTLGH